jgi:hypothetical protein
MKDNKEYNISKHRNNVIPTNFLRSSTSMKNDITRRKSTSRIFTPMIDNLRRMRNYT